MANPLLDEFYRFNKNGIYQDIAYPFEASAQLRAVLASLSENQQLCFVLTASGSLQGTVVVGNPPGWRVLVNGTPIYLLLEVESMSAQERETLAANIHSQLLATRLYYGRRLDILEYWRKPDDEFNRPELYASDDALERSAYLARLIQTHCPSVRSALEVGCNIGRNLNYLHSQLGLEVAALEISAHALELLKATYPGIANIALYDGDAAVRIAEIGNDRYDLVYSMAVLMHMHPDSPASLWEDIARVANTHVITIENESMGSDRNWVRNYEAVFTALGLKQIHAETPPENLSEFGGYVTRIFATS